MGKCVDEDIQRAIRAIIQSDLSMNVVVAFEQQNDTKSVPQRHDTIPKQPHPRPRMVQGSCLAHETGPFDVPFATGATILRQTQFAQRTMHNAAHCRCCRLILVAVHIPALIEHTLLEMGVPLVGDLCEAGSPAWF